MAGKSMQSAPSKSSLGLLTENGRQKVTSLSDGQSRRLCCLNELKGRVFQLRLTRIALNYPVVRLCWNTQISVCSALIFAFSADRLLSVRVPVDWLFSVVRLHLRALLRLATNRLREKQIALQPVDLWPRCDVVAGASGRTVTSSPRQNAKWRST
jgi:hypothetical protein